MWNTLPNSNLKPEELWSITAEERAKHNNQFGQLGPDMAGFISGQQAKNFFLLSGLPPLVLAKVWSLADINGDGRMDRREFSIAMHLIKITLLGNALPSTLPQSLLRDPLPLASASTSLPYSGLTPVTPLGNFGTAGPLGNTGMGMGSMGYTMGAAPRFSGTMLMPSLVPMSSNLTPRSNVPLQPNTSFTLPGYAGTNSTIRPMMTPMFPLGPQSFNPPPPILGSWSMSPAQRQKYFKMFDEAAKTNKVYLTGAEAKEVLAKTNLTQSTLARIWALADMDGDGKLTKEEFSIAIHLAEGVNAGRIIPSVIPAELRPLNSPALPARPSNTSVTSLATQLNFGPSEAATPQVDTFELRRRENFSRGQAELERRREQLREQQKREQEEQREFERMERERQDRARREQESRRLEAQRRQDELRRQAEREREEAHRKEVERREEERKQIELNRQREWMLQRRQKLVIEKQRESSQVAALSGDVGRLAAQLSELDVKKRELSANTLRLKSQLSAYAADIESMKRARDFNLARMDELQKESVSLNENLRKASAERTALTHNPLLSQTVPSVDETYKMAAASRQNFAGKMTSLRGALNDVDRTKSSNLAKQETVDQQLITSREELGRQRKACMELRGKIEAKKQELAQQRARNLARQQQEELKARNSPVSGISRVNGIDSSASNDTGLKSGGLGALRSQWESLSNAQSAVLPSSIKNEIKSNDFERTRSIRNPFQPASDNKGAVSWGSSPVSTNRHREEVGFVQEGVEPAGRVTDIDMELAPPTGHSRYIAQYQFDARAEDELSLAEGDVVWVPDDQSGIDPDWIKGRNVRTNQEGIFPSNYVQAANAVSMTTVGFSDSISTFTSTEYSSGSEGLVVNDGLMNSAVVTETVIENVEIENVVKNKKVPATNGGTSIGVNIGRNNGISGVNDIVNDSNLYDNGPPVNYPAVVRVEDTEESVSSAALQYYMAIYTYESTESNDLTFTVGEILAATQVEGEWWTGYRVSDPAQKSGEFPWNYVRKLTAEELAALTEKPTGKSPAKQHKRRQSKGDMAVVIAGYSSTGQEQITLVEGELVRITRRGRTGWWEGEIIKGDGSEELSDKKKSLRQVGWFPANYVRVIQTDSGGNIPDAMYGNLSSSGTESPRISADKQKSGINDGGRTNDLSVNRAESQSGRTSAGPAFPAVNTAEAAGSNEATAVYSTSDATSNQKSVRASSCIPVDNVVYDTKQATQIAADERTKSVITPNGAVGGVIEVGPSPVTVIDAVTTLYPYTAQQEDELSFVKGAVIEVVDRDMGDWWRGSLDGHVGLFPANYVTPSAPWEIIRMKNPPGIRASVGESLIYEQSPSGVQWSQDAEVIAMTSELERKRQNYIHELITTEETYMKDLTTVIEVFYEPFKTEKVLTEEELNVMFINWKELQHCNNKLLRALRVRRKNCGGEGKVILTVGDVLVENLGHMSAYVRFCSGQLNSASLLEKKSKEDEKFKEVHRRCLQTNLSRTGGMPLSSFLLKPMQRITKYPLLIGKIFENSPRGHPDHENCQAALAKATELCSQVNEGVREKENSDRLEWVQSRVHCDGLSERITFNSPTNSLGPRKYLHSGCLFKMKSNKELIGILFNDFLLLAQPQRPLPSSTASIFNLDARYHFKMYRTPIFLNDVIVERNIEDQSESGSALFNLSLVGGRRYSFRAASAKEREDWVRKMEAASRNFLDIEARRKREKSTLQRSMSAAVGRLLVVIVEGSNLVARDDCKSDPYCEVSMGVQEHKTKVINNSLNPKWNSSMQFNVKNPAEDTLCITVYDRDLYSPNDFLGRTEIKLSHIAKLMKSSKGPITQKLVLHEVESGEVTVKLDLQLFGRTMR